MDQVGIFHKQKKGIISICGFVGECVCIGGGEWGRVGYNSHAASTAMNVQKLLVDRGKSS